MNELEFTRATSGSPPGARPAEPAHTPADAGVDPLSRWRLRLHSEGKRAVATRVSVMLRYTAYMFTIIVASSLTHAALTAAGTTSYGGGLMWFSAFLMTTIAAGACVLYPNHRNETIDQYRHYTFGLCVFPGTAIAGVIWALRNVVTSPAAQDDTLASLLGFAVPAIFVCTVVIPPIIFVKLIAGYHTLHKSVATDTEMVSSVTRQDHLNH